MKIGVIGGLGLLGRATVDQVAAQGHQPVVIDRAVPHVGSATVNDRGSADVEHRRADVRCRPEIADALRGLDAVIHTASLIDLHLGRPAALHDINVAGAENVVLACRRNGIPRLVHMSSAEAISGAAPVVAATEERAAYPSRHLTHYGLTKQAGEEVVLHAADGRLGTCAMRTYGLFGVGDNTVVPLYLKTLPGRSIVHIGDLTARTDVTFAPNLGFALVLAAEQLEPGVAWSGTPFHITDADPVNIQRFLSDLVAPFGYRVVDRIRLPRSVAEATAGFYRSRYRLTGLTRHARPPLTDHKLRLALDHYHLDSSRVTEILGYRPVVGRADAIESTREWLAASPGLLRGAGRGTQV